jgi:type III restriction enzyme
MLQKHHLRLAPSKAMEQGYVKEPAVVTQNNFDPTQFTAEQVERIKLEDGIRIHEAAKAELETYALQNGKEIVKPVVLVIVRDTAHAAELKKTDGIRCVFQRRVPGQGNTG